MKPPTDRPISVWGPLLPGFAITALLSVAWLVLGIFEIRKLTPVSSRMTFSQYVLEMPRPAKLFVLEREGEHLVAVGEPPSTWTVPSGPPIYIFSRSGELEDWTSDYGDAPEFRSRWGRMEGRTLTPEQAMNWTREQSDSEPSR